MKKWGIAFMHQTAHQPREGGCGVSPETKVEANEVDSFSEALRAGRVESPILLMNLPLSLSAQVPNNAWMDDISPEERHVRLDRAIAQFNDLYKHVAQHAIIYLLPSRFGLQDQTYVSNLAVTLPHSAADTVVVSRFRSAPRIGESEVGADFFKLMNFTVERPPEMFKGEPLYLEGEADLKHLRGKLYVGAHGMRTSRNALAWLSERFGMEIIPFRITDPYLYHLDCCVFRLTGDTVLLSTSIADPESLRAIERHCEIVDVSIEDARAGVTNCVMLPGEVLCDSNIFELGSANPKYASEKGKIDRLEKLCARFGLSLRVFCMSEFYKSGALLSCLVMHIKHAAGATGVPRPHRLEDAL